MKKYVIIDFDIEGYHFFPNAPNEVEFLRHEHRHLFQIRCAFEVTDLNREVEIFIKTREVKEWIDSVYGTPAKFGNESCEFIALNILYEFSCEWVEVFEDGKGGGKVCQ